MIEQPALQSFVSRHRQLFVLTGAGCSVNSGIPDYRDADGAWKRSPPVTFQAFMAQKATRRRYWARSLIGWRRIGQARPNAAHRALTRLEAMGKSEILLTQNVDRLHQAAGAEAVIDLHGRIDHVRCMEIMRPYLGTVVGAYSDWTPLQGRNFPFPEAIDAADPWQFSNFRVV